MTDNIFRQIEILYRDSSYNLCAELFIKSQCRINYINTYYNDNSSFINKQNIIKFLRALQQRVNVSSIISPHECLFYIFHCFIPFTYEFIEEILEILTPQSIEYISVMLDYYKKNYNINGGSIGNYNNFGINGRYALLKKWHDNALFMYSLRFSWITACIKR